MTHALPYALILLLLWACLPGVTRGSERRRVLLLVFVALGCAVVGRYVALIAYGVLWLIQQGL